MNFEQSQTYLYNLGNEVLAMKLGLENISRLLVALGNPERNYLKVQIAGTNGKGSTVAFLEAICVAADISVGATVSPHLIFVTERVRIGGAEISKSEFAKFATLVRETSENLVKIGELETVPTYFEQVTAIALVAFAEAKVELAILETGLGGRFDATTAARAEIVAITPIDYDHQQILGETLTQIAAEKAAIIRKDTRVVIAPQKKEAERVIDGKCREVGIEPIRATDDYKIKKDSEIIPMLYATFHTPNGDYPNVMPSLLGRHQFQNAATAVSIAETLREFGFSISKFAITIGLENAQHKGRLEFYRGIIFDGAHNIGGAEALCKFLDEFVEKPISMIFGAMRDKDLSEIAELVFPRAEKLILTEPKNERSMKIENLLQYVPSDLADEKIYAAQTVREAIEKAREISGDENLILVTGSLYLVGEAQEILQNSF